MGEIRINQSKNQLFKVIDELGLSDMLSKETVETDDIVGVGHIYIVNDEGEIEDRRFFKNVVTDQGRYLVLQRLSGVAGNPDLTEYTVRYFAVGDGATISANSLVPERSTVYDTDLAHILAPFNPSIAKDGKFLPITTVTFEAQYILHFQIVLGNDMLKENVRINEIGLFAANKDNTDFKLFARATISEVVLVPNRYYIGDWWIILRKLA